LTPAEIEELKKIEALQVEEAKKYMDRIVKWRAINAYDLHEKIERLFSEIPKRKIKFVVVDSGTQLFREEYLGRGNISAKFQLMNQTINKLKHVAEVYNIPVLFVNQIYHKPDEMFGADADIPYGGNIIGHAIPYRLKFWKSGRRHAVRIVKSPHQDNLDCKFEIARSGLVDPQ
jgi:RecA/RadA recombinase